MPTCECKIHSNISEDLDYSIILQTLYVKSCTSSNCMAYCHFCYLSLWVNIHLYWMKRSSLDYVLKDNSGAKWTFGLITHCYLVNRFLRFVFMIAEC